MKYYVYLFALLWWIPLAAQEVESVPRLERAVVYRNSARLEYHGKVRLSAGNVYLTLKGLSPYLIPETIELRGLGDAEIVHFRFVNNYLINPRDNAKIRELENRLRELEKRRTLLEARINALRDELQILKANAKSENPDLNRVRQYVQYYRRRYEEVMQQIFDLEQKLKPVAEEADKVRKQLKELKGKARRKAKDLVVYLYVPRPITADYGLTYLTRRAGWDPAYSLRARSGNNEIDWTYQAEVSQETGIDWENVEVSLSTLSPRYHLRLPKPSPWYLQKPAPVMPVKNRKAREAAQVQGVVVEAEAAPHYMESRVEESDIDVQYTLPARYNVLSGEEPLLLTLRTFRTPAEFTHYTVPYLSRNVFLRARVSGLDKYRLLPGKARLYYMDRYTGETYLNPRDTDGKIEIGFGTDPEVTVERKTVKNFKDYSSLGNKITVKREYEIKLKNHKKTAVDVVVKDRVPVSMDEKIEVRNIRIGQGGKKDKNGIITWKVRLNPGEEKVLTFGFEVKYPKDYKLYF
ncbi:MAG: mucoidy inhibitor MuiA family protein [Chlorobi bacterium]|nr:mucoidy inhibitor MuiA family protein [Chlorobiota bacterium]